MSFYTYLWLREDGTPYYVGKGKGDRAFRKGSPPVQNILLQEYPDELAAFAAESFLISFYGRKDLGMGCLINLTDGGEGQSGVIPSEESNRKRSEALKNRPLSLETCYKMSQSHKGILKSPETRQRMSISQKGNTKALGCIRSEETRRKISEAKRRAGV